MALSSAAQRLKYLIVDLPIPDERVHEAESLIKQCTEAELSALGLGPPPRPVVPRGLLHETAKDGKPVGPQQRLHAVQHVINSLQYNHTPGYYYNVSKSRPFSRIMDTAREALRAALPIKCLEAVFLGTLLTAGWLELDRLPLAFKSTVQGQTYRHIVLVVFHGPSRKWGALGLSRRPELMDKDLVYDSLADLVTDFKMSYERWWHTLVRVYVGLPLEHDTYYAGAVCWRYLTLSLSGRKSWMTHRASLDKFAAQARRLAAKFRAMGGKPTTNGSIGGPEAQPQQPSTGQASSPAGAASSSSGQTDRGGGAAGERAPGRSVANPPAAGTSSGVPAAQRYAKSVSPTKRRPPPAAAPLPPPPPRRPITPSRTQASPGRDGGGASKGSSGSPAAGTLRRHATPPHMMKKAAQGSSLSTAAASSAASRGPDVAPPPGSKPAASGSGSGSCNKDGHGKVASSKADAIVQEEANAPGGLDSTSTCGPGFSAHGEAEPAGAAAPACDGQAKDAVGGEVDADAGATEGNLVSPAEIELRERLSWRSRRPRRSSDPGSAAAAQASAAQATGQGSRTATKEHVRMLRQQVRTEEQDTPGSQGRVEEEDDEVEEDIEESEEESSEEEYISDGTDEGD